SEGRFRCAHALQEGHRERQARARSEEPPRRWRELPGAGRSESRPPHLAGDPLAAALFARPRREGHERQARERIARRRQRTWRRHQEERRRPQNGRGQQSLRPLSLVKKSVMTEVIDKSVEKSGSQGKKVTRTVPLERCRNIG